MAKDLEKILQEEIQRDRLHSYSIAIPDVTTEKMSCWTYSDMKREFAESMDLFVKNGFANEAVSLAERCIQLRAARDIDKSFAMTENAMLFTIILGEAYKANDLRLIHERKNFFNEQIDKWRNAPKHSLTLSAEEQSELDRDIDYVREMISSDKSEEPSTEKRWFDPDDELGFDDACRTVLKRSCTEQSTEIMRQRLSPEAYAMITEYKRRRTFTDPDDFEKKVLLPKNLKMTDKLREFIEIYDGRAFAWRSAYYFEMDVPFSHHNFDGFWISFGGNICLNDGKYYISTMDYHYAGDWGPHIDENGKIYKYWCGSLELAADSMEEFLEQQAREYRKDELLLKRRRELENKYLIPEIRTASK